MSFKIGEEEFQTLKEFDQALRARDYPQTVWVSKEQMAAIASLLQPHADEMGVFAVVGLSKVRSHAAPGLDTVDEPKWRKAE